MEEKHYASSLDSANLAFRGSEIFFIIEILLSIYSIAAGTFLHFAILIIHIFIRRKSHDRYGRTETWQLSTCALNLPQNYAIEATITFVRSTENHGDYEVDLMGRGDGTSNGYGVGAYAFLCYQGCYSKAAISLLGIGNNTYNGTNTTRLTRSSYTLDTKSHTFKADFQSNTIKFSIDGAPYSSTTDNTYLDAGRIGLRVYDADVNVTSFKVLAL